METWERQEDRKQSKKRKRDGIQTAELDRRDQVTATRSWPNFPSRKGNRGRLSGSSASSSEYTQLAPSDKRSTKSADGRVATEAAWLNGNNLKKKKTKKRKTK